MVHLSYSYRNWNGCDEKAARISIVEILGSYCCEYLSLKEISREVDHVWLILWCGEEESELK